MPSSSIPASPTAVFLPGLVEPHGLGSGPRLSRGRATDALGDAVDEAERRVPRTSYAAHYRAVERAVRDWAVSEPAPWLLVFGSPIPGYQAPQDTVASATRLPPTLAALLSDALAAGAIRPGEDLPADVHVALELREYIGDEAPDEVIIRGLVACTYILGGGDESEVIGHRHRVVSPGGAAAVYERELEEMVTLVGFKDTGSAPSWTECRRAGSSTTLSDRFTSPWCRRPQW